MWRVASHKGWVLQSWTEQNGTINPHPLQSNDEGRKEQKRAILASLKWGEGWSRCSIYFVQDCRPVFDMLATVTAGNLWLFKRKEFHCELEIVFTIAAPAFDILFIGKDYHWVWFMQGLFDQINNYWHHFLDKFPSIPKMLLVCLVCYTRGGTPLFGMCGPKGYGFSAVFGHKLGTMYRF